MSKKESLCKQSQQHNCAVNDAKFDINKWFSRCKTA